MCASNSPKIRLHKRSVQIELVGVLGLLWLVSCQNFSNPDDPFDTKEAKIYQGRIAFKSPDESFVSVFRWQELNANFQLTLRDRLALGGIRIRGNENTATVEFSNGAKEENVDLDDWIEANLGITVPFVEMWKCLSLQCKLIDEAEQQEYDHQGRLKTFSHNQWKFAFSYLESGTDSSILRKLEFHKDDVKVRIFFSKFKN